jgi:hypothetical protein
MDNFQHLSVPLSQEMNTPCMLEDIQFCGRDLIYGINDALWLHVYLK